MDFQKDAYLLAIQRQRQLHELAAKRRLQPAKNKKTNPSLLTTVKNGLRSVKQLPRLRVQVSFYIKEPPQNARANA